MKQDVIIIPSDENANVIEIKLADFPQLLEGKILELIDDCGLSREEATKMAKETIIPVEFFYHKSNGLFAVESEAVDSCDLVSPYDGETKLVYDVD